ncbi:hypothetical protein ARMSODRAFT_895409, partial [Armillaria solidipes]
LIGPGDWETTLRQLENKDIRAYSDAERRQQGPGRRGTNEDSNEPPLPNIGIPQEDEINLDREEQGQHDGTGETQRTLSWIWLTTLIDVEDRTDKNNDILQSEWCRSRARASRSKEEVLLLREEMCKVLKFLEWRSSWWHERKGERLVTDDSTLAEGLAAYVEEQGQLQHSLRSRFQLLWAQPLEEMEAKGELPFSLDDESGEDNDDGDDDDDGIMGDQLDRQSDDEDEVDEAECNADIDATWT